MTIWRPSPFVAIVSVLALAMSIGFTTTMFSIVRGATRSLPFAEPHEVVALPRRWSSCRPPRRRCSSGSALR